MSDPQARIRRYDRIEQALLSKQEPETVNWKPRDGPGPKEMQVQVIESKADIIFALSESQGDSQFYAYSLTQGVGRARRAGRIRLRSRDGGPPSGRFPARLGLGS